MEKQIKEYWQQRCMAAEKFASLIPCDPDVTIKQAEAYQEWQEKKEEDVPEGYYCSKCGEFVPGLDFNGLCYGCDDRTTTF